MLCNTIHISFLTERELMVTCAGGYRYITLIGQAFNFCPGGDFAEQVPVYKVLTCETPG